MTRHARRLSAFYFAYFALIGGFMPYWNVYLEQRGFDKAQIGLLATVTVLTRVVAPGLWGWLADRGGRRMRWVRLGLLAELLVWLFLWVQLPHLTFAGLLVVLALYAFFQNAILAQFEAVALIRLAHDRARYGVIRQWGSLGFVVAVAGLGWAFGEWGLGVLPAVLAVLALAGLVVACWVPEVAQGHQVQERVALWPVLRQTVIWRFFVLEGVLLLSHAPFYGFYSNHLQANGHAVAVVGLLWTLGVLAEMLMFQRSGWWLKRFDERFLLALCLGLSALRWLVVGLWPMQALVQAGAQLLHAFGFALFQVLAMQRLAIGFAPALQGRAQGLFSMVWGLGVGLGSWLAGAWWPVVGGTGVFVGASLVALVGVGWVWFLPVALAGTAPGADGTASSKKPLDATGLDRTP